MKIHFVYETINTINGKKYIGKHSTSDIDDGYLGSGIALKAAIAKYGAENFTRSVLAIFDTSEAALEYERKLVTRDIVESSQYYNILLGGGGDGNAQHFLCNLTPAENARKSAETLKSDPHKLAQRNKKISVALQRYYSGERGVIKAQAMNVVVRGKTAQTADSIRHQVETRKSNHCQKMNKLLIQIAECSELGNAELQDKFSISYCTLLRCRKRIEHGLRWEDEIPDNLPHRLNGTANAEWRKASTVKRAELLRGQFIGEKSALSKLTDAQREEIHQMVINLEPRKIIQAKFNHIVNNCTINKEIVKALYKYNIANFPKR